MSYTFGGATADDITASSVSTAAGGNGSITLAAGWFYPTTLTSGRFYWSCGNVIGASVNSTTDQLLMFTDNTTDGQWTCDPNITTNKWWFLAWLFTCTNTGPAAAWRVWVGDADNPPAEVTVTNTVAPSGNFTGNSNRTVGNRGTGTVAFQGDIGWFCIGSHGTAGNNTTFGVETSGTITDDIANLNLRRWVYPLWLATPSTSNCATAALSDNFGFVHFDLGHNGVKVYERLFDSALAVQRDASAVNGATFTNNFPPRQPPRNWAYLLSPSSRGI